jgi:hypothetical protein
VRSIDESERRGDLPGFVATLLREAAKRAPVKFLVEQAPSLSDLFGEGGSSLVDLLDQVLG